VLTYWALRKAGMPRKESASRMVAFNVLLYAVYMLTLVINGILLRTGVFNGPAPAGLTIVPAAIAGGMIAIFLFIALIPGNLERRFSTASQHRFWGRWARRLATVPSTLAVGTREAMVFVRDPSRGGLALIGAIGFWATQIAILWASFKAFDAHVPLAVVVQGFFVGMAANMLPTPGGVGAVDAGLIGTFVLFGVSGVGATVIPAVLLYRLVAFWLPMLPGVIAFAQLRRTVVRWSADSPARLAVAERTRLTETSTSESKV
nr:flippase-like domain-containing protein [Chloroflexia bacterium]